MAIKGNEIVRRKDYYEVDPRNISIEEGWNKRKDFTGHEELKASIMSNGVQVPLRLRRDGDIAILVDGERRLRAVLELIKEGHVIEAVPAIYERRSISQTEAMLVQLLSNDGKPFTPSEEAEAYRQLEAWGVDKKEIARRVGRSMTYIMDRLALVDAAAPVRKAVDEKAITIARAKHIVKNSRRVSDQTRALKEPKVKVCDLGAVKAILKRELKKLNGTLSSDQRDIARVMIKMLREVIR